MKHALAIMAHTGAQPTVDDFLPRWRMLDAELYCSLPLGDEIQGFNREIHLGKSAHAGFHAFERFALTLESMTEANADHITIAEYDTVNLRPEMPRVNTGFVTSYFILANGPREDDPMQVCALSPWVMDRGTGIMLAEACRKSLESDRDFEKGKGLLDRWIGAVISRNGIPHKMGHDMLGYPWHPGAHDRIRKMGFNWIHGWKSKEDFGTLWPQSNTKNKL